MLPDLEEDYDPVSISQQILDTFKSGKNFEQDVKSMFQPSHVSGKILGVGYSYESDVFHIRISERETKEVTTMRELSSLVSSVYDPLGFVNPFILIGRLQMQEGSRSGLTWDDTLPDRIKEPVEVWRLSIPSLRNVEIPRWTCGLGFDDRMTKLVCFNDASLMGYGACLYIRRSLRGGGKDAQVSLLTAKSHVVPAQIMKGGKEVRDGLVEDHGDSVPRLELHSCRLAAIMRDYAVRFSGEVFNDGIVMFTDSATALSWIKNWEGRFKTFETFRLKKIRLLTDTTEWEKCRSEDNPADSCSKGLKPSDKGWTLFHSGPEWLKEDVSNWPSDQMRHKPDEREPICDLASIYADEPEDPFAVDFSPLDLMCVNAIDTRPEIEGIVDEVSSVAWQVRVANLKGDWKKKLTLIARFKDFLLSWMRFLKERKVNKKAVFPKDSGGVSVAKIIDAENCLVRGIQQHHFEEELLSLIRLGVFTPNAVLELKTKKSRLLHLSPFLDEENVIRVGGRIGKAQYLPYNTRYPRILPNKDLNVKSLIRFEHEMDAHSSRLQTFFRIRQRWFILGGRSLVNSVLSTCIPCQKRDRVVTPQREADLPAERLEISIPFKNIAIDVFGPFIVKHGGRGTQKRWVLLINDLPTRAVVLLPLIDMTASTFINAIEKFNAFYQCTEMVVADNGTNFRGASKEIREAILKWNKEQISQEFFKKGLTWRWGPPRAAHVNGVSERLVASSKKHLKILLGNEVVHNNVFETFIAMVSGILNRRPLTYASSDTDDPHILCPLNLIFPYSCIDSATTIMPPTPSDGDCVRANWQTVRSLLDRFWEKWRKEYIITLQERKKWTSSSKNPFEGQIVLICDDLVPRGLWRTGIVEKLIGEDPNHIRRVLLRLPNGSMMERHVLHVVPLEMDPDC